MDIEQLTTFLAWCTAINIALLVISTLALWLMRDFAARLHGAMFGLPQIVVLEQFYSYLATYKLLILVFNLVPYLALRIM